MPDGPEIAAHTPAICGESLVTGAAGCFLSSALVCWDSISARWGLEGSLFGPELRRPFAHESRSPSTGCFCVEPSRLSFTKHGPDRVDSDEHAFRMVLEALETETPVERHAARKDLVSTIVDRIQDDQLETGFTGHMQGAAERVHRKVRAESPALPASVHGDHGKIQRRNAAGVGGPSGPGRPEVAGRNRMRIQRIVAEHSGRSFGNRDEYPRKVVLLLLSGAETQEIVESIRTAGKAGPVMPGGVERLDNDSGRGRAITLH